MRFLQVCTSDLAAKTSFELAWGNYLKLIPGDYRLGLEARGMLDRAPKDSYKETRELRTYLARKGHYQSVDWLQAEGTWEDFPSIGKGVSSWDKGATFGAATMYSGGGNFLNPNTWLTGDLMLLVAKPLHKSKSKRVTAPAYSARAKNPAT